MFGQVIPSLLNLPPDYLPGSSSSRGSGGGGSFVTNQSLPIVLPVQTKEKEFLESQGREKIVLRFEGKAVAVLSKPEWFQHRKEERCARTFGTTHPDHPGIEVQDCKAIIHSETIFRGKNVLSFLNIFYVLFLAWLNLPKKLFKPKRLPNFGR